MRPTDLGTPRARCRPAFALALLAGTLVLPLACGSRQTVEPQASEVASELLTQLRVARLAEVSATEWSEPEVWTAEGAAIDGQIEIRYADNRIGSHAVRLRSYNGGLTGPTLRFAPGDVVSIGLQNSLPPEEPSHDGVDEPHGFNVTNLHTHGLHVSPRDPGDNVLLRLEPGSFHQFRFEIPSDHPEGTFWYHAHAHGSTALQLASGMAGAMIVDGRAGAESDRPLIAERLFLFQQFPFYLEGDQAGLVEDFDQVDFPRDGDNKFKHTTVNGLVKPEFTMRPGSVERWRFVHGGVRENLSLGLLGEDGVPEVLHLIAIDGISLGRVEETTEVELAPGYRADVLVKAPARPGTYILFDREAEVGLLGEREEPQHLAVLRVEGEAVESPPAIAAEPAPLEAIDPGDVDNQRTFSMKIDTDTDPVRFLMNDREFDPGMEPVRLTLGDVEEWTLNSRGARVAHPFHVHVNPFLVVERNGQKVDPPVWRDTLLAPWGKDGSGAEVKVLTRFEDFDGEFVMHCHILPHEDQGMMLLVDIEKPQHEEGAHDAE